MTTLSELIKQKQELDRQIAELRKTEVSNAIAQARALVQEYELTAEDVFGGGSKAKSKGRAEVAAKYRDSVTGKTWSGRGKAPLWIKDKDRSQYLI